MPWYISIFLGCLFLPIMNYLFSIWEFTFKNLLYVSGFSIIVNLLFWYGFYNTKSYLFCYLLGGMFSIIMSFALSYFKGEIITLNSVIGIVLTILGLILIYQK